MSKSQLVGWTDDNSSVEVDIPGSSPRGLAIPKKTGGFRPGSSPSRGSLEERLFSEPPPALLSRRNSQTGSQRGDGHQQGKPRLKDMSKAERRALQEKQRAEKAAKQMNQSQGKQPQQRENKQKQQPASTPVAKSATTPVPPTLSKSTKKSKKQPSQSAGFLFTHLNAFEKDKEAILEAKMQKGEIHPAIQTLGLQFASFAVSGGNARCIAMLVAFKKIISDYVTPENLSLQRHMTSYIGKQIDFLTVARPLAASMKTAIRFVKNEIATVPADMPDEDAKTHLCETIDHFIRERIVFPMKGIVEKCMEKVRDGDHILTFGCSSLVLGVLKEAARLGKRFEVSVVDSRPRFDGRVLARELAAVGIPCSYMLINALGVEIKKVNKVIMGASAVLSNGSVMSRVGTAAVAMMAKERKVPVIICAETYKFSDSVSLDSFVWNEIGNPNDVARSSQTLENWEKTPNLNVLNFLYDITPSQYVTMVICEAGFIPSTSVPTVLREMGAYQHQ